MRTVIQPELIATARLTRSEEVEALLESLHSGEAQVKFWQPGASYRGVVKALSRGGPKGDTLQLTLAGAHGEPMTFSFDQVHSLHLVKDPAGRIVRTFPEPSGARVKAALAVSHVERGSFEDAVRLARDFHGPQTYGEAPYLDHLDAVVEILERFGYTDRKYKVAGILHDTLEDTQLSYREVASRFGKEAADMVQAVSLPKAATRDEAFALAYPRIKSTPGAVLIKLADRIANVEDAIRMVAEGGSSHHLDTYTREWPHFRDELRTASGPGPMWDYLEKLLTTRKVPTR